MNVLETIVTNYECMVTDQTLSQNEHLAVKHCQNDSNVIFFNTFSA